MEQIDNLLGRPATSWHTRPPAVPSAWWPCDVGIYIGPTIQKAGVAGMLSEDLRLVTSKGYAVV